MKSEVVDVDACEWYANEYDSGAVNENNYRESAAFLRGLYTAMNASGHIDDAGTSAIERAIATLQSGAGFIDNLRRHKAKVQIMRESNG